jgi:hypothetical protein
MLKQGGGRLLPGHHFHIPWIAEFFGQIGHPPATDTHEIHGCGFGLAKGRGLLAVAPATTADIGFADLHGVTHIIGVRFGCPTIFTDINLSGHKPPPKVLTSKTI